MAEPPDPRPVWIVRLPSDVPKSVGSTKVVPLDMREGLPADAAFWCREGELEWRPITEAQHAAYAAKQARQGAARKPKAAGRAK